MKSWRRGFMRCRSREGPCGSHHEAASREKCDTSVSDTEDVGEGVARCGRGAAVENGLRCFELDGDVDVDAGATLGRSRAASRRRFIPRAGLVIDMLMVVRNRGSSHATKFRSKKSFLLHCFKNSREICGKALSVSQCYPSVVSIFLIKGDTGCIVSYVVRGMRRASSSNVPSQCCCPWQCAPVRRAEASQALAMAKGFSLPSEAMVIESRMVLSLFTYE